MRFMIMHKVTDEMEKGLPPEPAVIEGVGKLISEGVKDRIFHGGEGLKPTSQRVHLSYKGGARTLTEGPFEDAKELVGGYALLRVGSKEEALGWCDRFAATLGDVDMFLGPVVEPWDLGMAPKPANPPLRFLAMHQLDERRAGTPPSPDLLAKMGALIDEMKQTGVLVSTAGLAGTERGARVRFSGGKKTVIDGPFAESKELIAGYAILDLPSKAAALEWAARFGDVVKVNEVEVREVAG